MNKFTLSFVDINFETKYQSIQHKHDYKIFQTHFYTFLLIALVVIINNLINGNYFISVLTVGLLALLIITRQIARTSTQFFDFFIFFMIVIGNLAFPLSFYFDFKSTSHQNQYYIGQAFSYLTFSLMLGSRFYLKAIIHITNIFGQIILINIKQTAYQRVDIYLFVIFMLLIINFTYLNEKSKRMLYLLQYQGKQWQGALDQALDISIIYCKYDKQLNKIMLVRQNDEAAQNLKITCQNEMNDFIRTTLVQTENILSKKRFTLEKFLYILNSDINDSYHLRDKQKNSTYSFQGIRKNSCFSLKVVQIFDQDPLIILIIQNELKSKQIQYLQQKIQMMKMICKKYSYFFNEHIKKCVIVLKGSAKQTSSKYIINQRTKSILFFCLEKLYLAMNCNYNIQFFLFPNLINGLQLKKLNILSILNNIIQIQKYHLKQKNIKIQIKNNMKDPLFVTFEIFVTQLFFNLLINCIENSEPNNTIFISLEWIEDNDLKQDKIQIQINQKGNRLTAATIKKLPFIHQQNAKYFESTKQSAKIKSQIQLGLWISISLLRILGPRDEIKFSHQGGQQKISFQLYQDLSNLNPSLKQISKYFNPLKKIIFTSDDHLNPIVQQNFQTILQTQAVKTSREKLNNCSIEI